MDFFWSNVFEYFKDRRIAAVFFGTLMVLVGLLLAGAILFQTVGAENMQTGLVYSSPVLAALFVVWLWRSVARARARRRDRYQISPLSGDEMRKARSRLMRVKL